MGQLPEEQKTDLITLHQEAVRIENLILENDDGSNSQLEAFLEAVDSQIASKADGYDHVLKRAETTKAMLKERAQEYINAARALDNFQDRLRERIKSAIMMRGESEVRGNGIKFVLSKTKGKLIVDDKSLPSYFMRMKLEPDNEAIRSAIESGEVVEGAQILETYSLRTVINKGELK